MKIGIKLRTAEGAIRTLGPFPVKGGDIITITDGLGEEVIWVTCNHESFWRRLRASILRKHQGKAAD